MEQKRKILVLIDWFLPGIKAGGPVRSVASLVHKLHAKFDFYILTGDTDLGESKPYSNIESDKWVEYRSGIQIHYKSKNKSITDIFLDSVNIIKPDCIYINSFFSKDYSILPLQLIKKHRINTKVILAPRGMLSKGALKIKPFKKQVFISLSKLSGLHKHVIWHTTKEDESKSVKQLYGQHVKVFEVNNLTDIEIKKPDQKKEKQKNELKLIYLGRIARNKNLSLSLKALKKVTTGNITFDIYGTIEDPGYWQECEDLIKQLGTGVNVTFKGSIQPNDIGATVVNYHFLTLLSFSENFGHAIVEALASSIPVIISNTTPWLDLPKHRAGWDVAINDELKATEAYKQALELNREEYYELSCGAYTYALTKCISQENIDKTIKMFEA